mgnify:CR=1 FL=1|jgi:hypothetical protein
MSYVQTVNFSFDINCSLQVGDQVYKTATSTLGGFEQNLGATTIHVGSVFGIISPTSIEVLSEYVDPSTGLPLPYNQLNPNGNDYISFSKNRVVNNNDLLGYYASVHFVNNSTKAAKLWSVGSGVAENSK